MRQITCPICRQSPEIELQAFSYRPCVGCGNRWTYLPEELDSAALYEDAVYAIVDNRKSIFERIISREAKKILQTANSLVEPSARRLLDFGSGKGIFLAAAKAVGWQGLGIETAKDRAAFAREKYGADVLQEFYSGGVLNGGAFDFVALNHVLEHLPDPLGLLTELLDRNLSRNGVVYIEVPRADSWQASIAGQHWMHWDIPRHLTHWTQAGLERALHQMGYQTVEERCFSVHLGVLGMLQALMSCFGFRENLILNLKQAKRPGLLWGIAMLFPFALILELLSVPFGKSGVIGVYLKAGPDPI